MSFSQTDKAAADAAHKAEHRIESHQPSLREAISELAEKRDPSTGQVSDSTVTSSTYGNPGTATGEPVEYWQAALVLKNQQQRLIAADKQFQEFVRTNTWGEDLEYFFFHFVILTVEKL